MRPTAILSVGPPSPGTFALRVVRLAGVAALLVTLAAVPIRATELGTHGQWMVYDARDAGDINLVLAVGRSKDWSHWSDHTLPFASLKGLSAAQLSGSSAAVRFVVERDAGTFVCEGKAGGGRGAGLFEIQLAPDFAAELSRRGIGRPTEHQQIRLAFSDVSYALLDELKAQRYPVPTVEQLVTMAEHGVDLAYVKGMAGYGFPLGSLNELVRMRDHGVDPGFIRGMAEAGYKGLTIDELLTARDHGVDPRYVADMASVGYRDLGIEDLLRARDHGVDARFARSVNKRARARVPLDELIDIRDHGSAD